jgi:hypothetical protein
MGVRAVAILATCLCPLAGFGQGLFKCTTKQGRTVYQDSKCDEESRQSVLKPPAPPASEPCPTALFAEGEDPRTAVSDPEARKEIGVLVDMLVNYEGCSAAVPGFASRFQGAYRQWHERSRDAFARYEAYPTARRMVECRVAEERDRADAGTAEGKEYKAKICMEMIGPGIERVAREGALPRPQ